MVKDNSIAERLQELCDNYWEPPVPEGMSVSRWESLIRGTRKPTIEDLVLLSLAFDVSINYLVTGDELFPSLHRIPEKDLQKMKDQIYLLTPEMDEQTRKDRNALWHRILDKGVALNAPSPFGGL